MPKRGLPSTVRMRHDEHYVEALAASAGAPIGRLIPIEQIDPNPNQPRQVMGDLSELIASIGEKGIIEPLVVRPRGERFQIVAGERRYQAAVQVGLRELPVVIREVDDTEVIELALIENLQRKDLTPFEEAEGYRMLAESHGYTHEEISESVGKSRTVVTESLSLLQMPPRVRDTVQALGITSKSLLLEVLKAGSEGEMIDLLEEVARRGLNRDDLRQRLRRGDKGGKSGRRKPYVFRFKAPDRTFSLSLSFRQSEVDPEDLIRALEQILADLRQNPS